jgi:hypothetical protein
LDLCTIFHGLQQKQALVEISLFQHFAPQGLEKYSWSSLCI